MRRRARWRRRERRWSIRRRASIDYLRVSVTDRCNYGCTYCIPDDGVDARGARRRAVVRGDRGAGAGVRVAGRAPRAPHRRRADGAPRSARRWCAMLRAIPGIDDIALSTNGHLLAELAAPLRAAGVDRLNVSLDSLDAERFRRITRRGDLARVLAGIEAARAAGFASIKLNTVAIARLQRRRVRPHLRLGVGARAGAALHRGDADGGRARLPAGRAAWRPPRSARRIAAALAGRARRRRRRRTPRGAPVRRATSASTADDGGGGPRAPLRDHLADDRALLHHLQPAAAVDGRARCTPAWRTTTPSTCAVRCTRAAPTPSPGRSAARSPESAPGHTFQLIGLGGPRKAMVQIGG